MFTATADLILPSTTTGSFPRPRWFDVSMWGRPLDTCMLDVRFREKFQDAMAVVISDQERAGLDILTHGDLHVDEDMAGRAWHHYPLAALGRLRGRPPAAGRDHRAVAPLSARHAAERNLHRLALAARRWQDRAPPARLSQALAHRAGQDAQARQVRHLLLPGDGAVPGYPHAKLQGQAPGDLGHGGGHEQGAAGPARRRLPLHSDRGAHFPLHGQHLRQGPRGSEVHGGRLQPRGAGAGRRRTVDSHLLGQPEHAARHGGHQLRQLASRSIWSAAAATSGRWR